MTQPRNDPTRNDVRFPCQAADIAIGNHPILDEGSCVLARDIVPGNPQMPEPTEAMQLTLPGYRWWIDEKGRLGACQSNRAGKAEMPVIDLCCETGIGGSEVVRHQQELLDRTAAKPPTV